MNNVTVLVQGYASINPDGSWEATSTTTLIESNGQKIIADPGCVRNKLVLSLKDYGLNVEDIDWVFLSHRHLDHTVLTGIFPKAKVIDVELFQDGPHGEMHEAVIPGTDVQILKTPGHAPHHGSLLANTTDKGTIAIAGDVFWWSDGVEPTLDVEFKDEFADGDWEDLRKSRSLLMEKADWIIPGHGPMMKVKK